MFDKPLKAPTPSDWRDGVIGQFYRRDDVFQL